MKYRIPYQTGARPPQSSSGSPTNSVVASTTPKEGKQPQAS
jgi:hypothetical protein